ncbi:hypothetical protein [Listeria costaricensis]|uniref:hypothetical protein n=1 Tax=Listeria costaricensis TaxID=2026604 RepID=UPI000C079401|nr:hypothetical protein [Listeria costaricensis]
MSEVVINADELEQVMNSLDELMGSLMGTMEQFGMIRNTPFYQKGQAKDEIERIFSSSARTGVNNADLVQMEADFYGKIQMLATYYNLLNEYCYNALITFKETDEKLAKLWEESIAEVMANG